MQKFPSLNFSHRFFQFLNWHVGCALLLIWVLILIQATPSAADDRFTKVISLIGPHDSLIVTDSEDRPLVSKNKNKKLVPASILKLLTSLAAFHYLGRDYRYTTEFYLDKHSNLKIKGYGDPLLVSEIVNEIAVQLTNQVGKSLGFNDLVVDDSQFNQPLTIPGISSSSQPYDAPNGALCVNFNTVFFKHTETGYISAEAQTPLLPYAETRIRTRNLKNGRFVLSHLGSENTIYAGSLFRYFLERHGAEFSGKVRLGQVNKPEDRLIYRYISRYSLAQIISKLLEYSSNFITNQLLISTGMAALGPPGNLDKGVAAVLDYTASVLKITDISIVEGSGISRRNRVSAYQMLQVLKEFEPHHRLMRQKGREFYKTGTLYGVSTRAGFIAGQNGNDRWYRYVVIINTPGKSTKPVMRKLRKILK